LVLEPRSAPRVLMGATREWLPQAAIPALRSSMHVTMLVHPELPDTIFAVGGDHPDNFYSLALRSPEEELDAQFGAKLNDGKMVWNKLPSMAKARLRPSVCCAKGCLVVVGGQISASLGAFAHASVERFDFVTQKWSALPNLPCMIINHDGADTLYAEDCPLERAMLPNHFLPRIVCMYDSILHYLPFGFYLDLASKTPLSKWEWQRAPYALTQSPFKRVLHSAIVPI
jgi:Kelch motif